MKITLTRKNKSFHFTATNEEGVSSELDGTKDIGGEDKGLRPMQLLLAGAGGCSAIDILLILKKQKQEVEDLQIEVDGEREQGKEPALWKKVHLTFKFKGKVEKEKARRAADLSMEKYCSVAETLRRAGAEISWEVRVNE